MRSCVIRSGRCTWRAGVRTDAFQAVEPLDLLGVCLAASGRFPDAIWAAQEALKLAQAAGHAEVAGMIKARLDLYELGQPYYPPQSPQEGE